MGEREVGLIRSKGVAGITPGESDRGSLEGVSDNM